MSNEAILIIFGLLGCLAYIIEGLFRQRIPPQEQESLPSVKKEPIRSASISKIPEVRTEEVARPLPIERSHEEVPVVVMNLGPEVHHREIGQEHLLLASQMTKGKRVPKLRQTVVGYEVLSPPRSLRPY